MTLTINYDERETLESKIEKMNRRSAKLGLNLPPISATYEQTTVRREVATEVWRDVVVWRINLTGEAPRINGWTLVCRVEHTTAGNLVTGPTGVEQDLSQWHDVPSTCDHCHTARQRRDTFVLRNEVGENIRVGRSCLADFVRSPDAERFADAAMWGDFFKSEFDEDGFSERIRFTYETKTVIAYSVASMRVDGRCVKGDEGSTRTSVFFALCPPVRLEKEDRAEWNDRQPTDTDKATADAVIAWAKVQTDSGYLHNLSVACDLPVATDRTTGLLVSAPQAYAKAMGTAAKREQAARVEKCDVPPEFEGKRVKLEGTAIAYKWQENEMGDGALKVLLRFSTPAGEWRGWMTASLAETESSRRGEGDRWTMTARVARKDFGFAILSRPTKCTVEYAKPTETPRQEAERKDREGWAENRPGLPYPGFVEEPGEFDEPLTEPDRASEPFAAEPVGFMLG